MDSYTIIHKFSSKLKVKFRCASKEIEKACSLISEAAAAVLDGGDLSAPVCRDQKDVPILACAEEAAAEYLVSGDKDLLVLWSACY